ncbi:MAG: terminase family protein [Marivibrio sp.]|uniref:terminase large subunit domain-containing protein n=1 Tax=Marivibrio sp. TaxID=2039719 RepID=UPI0032ED0E3A
MTTPALAGAEMAPAVPLYQYQQKWFLDRSRFKIGMFARQTGKTFTTTLELVDDCFEVEAKGGRTKWVVLSRGERQAKEAMREGVKLHAQAYGMGLEEQEIEFKAGDITYNGLEITLPGGSRITGLPANADTARGFSANVFLDEFAFHQDSRAIWKALFPVVSNGYKLRITSTPNGKGNKFYELFTGQDKRWSRHQVDIYQAVRDGLPRDVAELRQALNDEDAWAQEYELQWLDAASAWLDYDLIMGCEHPDAGKPELYQGGPVFLGNDIAARRDLWVLWVWELVGDVLWTREIIVRKRISFAEQEQIFDETFAKYHTLRAAMDQTGMGEKPVEDAKRKHGALRVEGVQLTSTRRLDIATAAKQRFEDKTVRIPAGDPVLRADLHQLKRQPSLTGAPRLVAGNDGDGHADRTWAGFLGIAAAETGAQPSEGATIEAADGAYGATRTGPIGGRGLVARPGTPFQGGRRSWR